MICNPFCLLPFFQYSIINIIYFVWQKSTLRINYQWGVQFSSSNVWVRFSESSIVIIFHISNIHLFHVSLSFQWQHNVLIPKIYSKNNAIQNTIWSDSPHDNLKKYMNSNFRTFLSRLNEMKQKRSRMTYSNELIDIIENANWHEQVHCAETLLWLISSNQICA